MTQALYRNPDPTVIMELESCSDAAKARYITWMTAHNQPVYVQYIKQERVGRIGIVVGYIDQKTGIPMVGWSICSKEDRKRMRTAKEGFSEEDMSRMEDSEKRLLAKLGQVGFNRLFRIRAEFYAFKRAQPAFHFLKPDKQALCEQCPSRAAPVVVEMVSRMVGEWARNLPHCHCPPK